MVRQHREVDRQCPLGRGAEGEAKGVIFAYSLGKRGQTITGGSGRFERRSSDFPISKSSYAMNSVVFFATPTVLPLNSISFSLLAI